MYIGHGRLCVCLSVSLQGPGCNLGNGRRYPIVVNYWADLQSVHGFRCYDNIAPNAKYQRVLVLALCLGYIGRKQGRRQEYLSRSPKHVTHFDYD